MPLYMDLHRGLKGVTREEAEHAHHLDEQVQDKYGVKYHKFWLNEEAGTIFCLMEGPNIAAPDQILISDIVKGLCMGRSFQFHELEAQNLKGFSQAVKTFIVQGS